MELFFRQGFQFAVSVVLARLLAPEEFGVVILLSFFTSLSSVFMQGLTIGLVQRVDTSQAEESGAFWVNVIAAVLFAGVLLASAGAVARFYEQPVLQPLMIAPALQIVFTAIGGVHNALLTRALRFNQLMKVGIAASVLSGAVGIGAAVSGLGVWALALQGIVAAAVTSVLLWVVSPWRPTFDLRFAALGRLWRFGSWVSLSTLLEVIYAEGFSLLLGKFYGVRDVGFFSRAGSTAHLPANILTMLVSRLTLPLFSVRSGDPAAVRRGARLAIGFSMLLNLPAMVGLALLAPEVIQLLFGSKWQPAAPILSILAIGSTLLPLHVINLQLVLARGESNLYFRLEILKKLIGIASLVGGSFFGIYGLAWSGVLFGFVAVVINALPNGRAIGYGALQQAADLQGLVAPTLALCAAVIAVRDLAQLPLLIETAMMIATGAVAYLLTGLGLRIALFREALDIGVDLLPSRRRAASGA